MGNIDNIVATAIATGIVNTIGVVIALRVDMQQIKARVRKLEDIVFSRMKLDP